MKEYTQWKMEALPVGVPQVEEKVFVTSNDGDGLTPETLEQWIRRHQTLLPHYRALKEMYEDAYPILNAPRKERYKPDNRLVVNFAKYIVNTFNGYFIGTPIKTTHEDDKVNNYLDYLDGYNNLDDQNAELSKVCSIYGHGYELLFNDERAQVGVTYLTPLDGFMVYDDSIRRKPLYGVRYYYDEEGKLAGTWSDSEKIIYFKQGEKSLYWDEEEPHPFDGVPMVEYVENEERKGVFESVATLINAYNKAVSEKANDVDYYADAYLKIVGAMLEDDALQKLRDSRIINVPYLDGNKADISFLEKPSNDDTQENLLNRLERLIFQVAMVSNISDKNFGEASGISLRYKLQPMDNLAKTKERKFTGAMNKRYQLIASFPTSPISGDDWVRIRYKFTRNIPANLLEESQIAQNLAGIVSEETQAGILSIVPNAHEEIERKRAEIEGNDGEEWPRVNSNDDE